MRAGRGASMQGNAKNGRWIQSIALKQLVNAERKNRKKMRSAHKLVNDGRWVADRIRKVD